MLIVRHRVNSRIELAVTPKSMGVEIDLRSRNDQIILEHDPFKSGELFQDWLEAWDHHFLVLNVKEEGLEERVVEILTRFGVDNYFFLDQSFPFMQKLIRQGNSQVAARASDLESVETALASGAGWCWLDSFLGDWKYLSNAVPRLNRAKIRTCLVSPELQRRDSDAELSELQGLILKYKLQIDAVCTKKMEKWQ